jgi:hypothetical protein
MHSSPVESWETAGNGVDICEVLVDECANSYSSDDDVARMRVTIFLTVDWAGRVKAEVKEVVHKGGDHLEVDNTGKADALEACDTSGTADIELTHSKAKDAHIHSVCVAHVKRKVTRSRQFQESMMQRKASTRRATTWLIRTRQT